METEPPIEMPLIDILHEIQSMAATYQDETYHDLATKAIIAWADMHTNSSLSIHSPEKCTQTVKNDTSGASREIRYNGTLAGLLKELDAAYQWMCPEDQGKAFHSAWEKYLDSVKCTSIMENEDDAALRRLRREPEVYAAFEHDCADCDIDLSPASAISQNHDMYYADGETQTRFWGFRDGYNAAMEATYKPVMSGDSND